MSADAVTALWGKSDLTYAQRFVAIAIADVVNDAHDNEFWMNPTKLGVKVGMSAGNVRRKMTELVDAGVLEVLEQGGGRGKSTTYRWALTEPRSDYAVPETASDPQETASESGETASDPTSPSSYRELKELKKNSIARRPVNGAAFAQFWELYPRKIGKPQAKKAYASALKRTTHDEIVDGVRRAAPDWVALESIRFIPHPTTWLNRDGWDDGSDAELEAHRREIASRLAREKMGLPDPWADEQGAIG